MFDKIIEFLLNIIEQTLPCYILHQYDKGIFYRNGKIVRAIGGGFIWKIPFLDSIVKENCMQDTMKIKEVNITTQDGKTVTIGCEFNMKIVDVIKALNDTNDWRSNLQDQCQGILSDSLEDLNWEDIRKKTVKNAIAKRIEKSAAEMGVTTSDFNFTDKAISRVYKLVQ